MTWRMNLVLSGDDAVWIYPDFRHLILLRLRVMDTGCRRYDAAL